MMKGAWQYFFMQAGDAMTPDAIDYRILDLLQANARMSFAEIGRQVGLTTPSTIERVKRLEEAGVITGYHAHINPSALGYTMGAIIRVTVAGERLTRFAQQVARIPEVLECHRVTGAESYILRVAVRDTQHLETVIDSMLPYVATSTSLILASPVKWRAFSAPKSVETQRRPSTRTRR
ncbi:MAG: Lrp/AsnC family transcriptional regulator [Edaphobacter sp.]|uniref:Lrp/AsnC family transcriptional regulator n=1 Tax=Edaphobacter sp. TaxID=1934404 RepID=UPI002382EE96|nr:Lrp/AsnC family transcriptional regulator [Edaphobacter sp.]MDE1176762.1 Lrp/AsnC family transcriptional regulator [Edaphobacter sp.]